MEDSNYMAHKLADPRLVGTRRLMIHIPETSLCYLPINQSKENQKIIIPAALIPHVAFKNPSLKAIKEFRYSDTRLPVLLAWCLQ